MIPKYTIGDIFVKKHTRDTSPLRVISVSYYEGLEPEYTLQSRFGFISLCGEEHLEQEYIKINK